MRTAFESEAKEQYGISCTEAVQRGLITRGIRWSHRKKDYVDDGWEPINCGGKFTTQKAALDAYMAQEKKERDKAIARANSITYADLPECCKSVMPEIGFTEDHARKAIRRLRSWVWDEGISVPQETTDKYFAFIKQRMGVI